MMDFQAPRQNDEHGNVLVYILIAVALLAALSFAVTQGIRGSMSDVSREKAKLAAGDILEYANAVGNAVAQLRLRGCADTQISFEASGVTGNVNTNAPGDHSCDVFHPDGGGVVYKKIPPEALPSNAPINNFSFSGWDAVENVGTADPELIIYGRGVQTDVCVAVNKLIGKVLDDAIIDEPQDIMAGSEFDGNYSANVTIGSAGSVFSGVRAGCFFSSPGGENVFYKVLIAR